MNHADRWDLHYNEVKEYILAHHRIPSKHRIEDHLMLNWLKYNRKRMAEGKLQGERLQRFEELMKLAKTYHKLNQYAYVQSPYQQEIPFK